MSEIPAAWLRPKIKLAIVPPILLVALVWSGRHVYESYFAFIGSDDHGFAFLWTLTFLSLVWHLALSWCERPFKTTPEQAG